MCLVKVTSAGTPAGAARSASGANRPTAAATSNPVPIRKVTFMKTPCENLRILT